MLKILICDDDQKITTTLHNLLSVFQNTNKIQFQIDIRSSGNFILTERLSYDIAFIDVEMPGISGLRLSEELKKYNPDIIVMIVTSYPNYIDDAMRIHVFRYISKPIEPSRFNANLLDAIDTFQNANRKLVIEMKDGVYTVKTKDILFIEKQRRGSVIKTKYSSFVTNRNLKEWIEIIN